MIESVRERFLKGNAHLHERGRIPRSHTLELFVQQSHERYDQLGIVVEDQCRFTPDETTQDLTALRRNEAIARTLQRVCTRSRTRCFLGI